MTTHSEPPIQIVSRAPDGAEQRSTITGATDLARLGLALRTMSQDMAESLHDGAARARAHRLHARAVRQVEGSVTGALGDELLALGVLDDPDEASATAVRLANAQLLGWLNGLFQQLDEALSPQGEQAEHEADGAARRVA